ncbi:hypothetical protein POM88_024127 [Heracleum sosnowskyi]|uniref:Uncharacterized protein n=1 Tax=Heracleum sosnowskyi TaxID=360622 RepID=A0AAD8IIH2_9APIA|nr:hypothetical protein POM88_024127 [Heracleum sosnowskyi]
MVCAVTSYSSPTLSNLAHKRHNVECILQNPMLPQTYSQHVGEVSVLLSEVHGPLQPDMMYKNASYYIKPGGRFFVSVKGDYKETFPPVTSPRTVIHEEFNKLLYRQFKHSWEVNLAHDHLYFLGSWLGDSSSVAQMSKPNVDQVCAEPEPDVGKRFQLDKTNEP